MDFVFIHGAFHGAWAWAPLIEALKKKGHTGFAFDLPGSGSDATPRDSISYDDYRRAILQEFDGQDFKDVVLVGHSFAGMHLVDLAKDLEPFVSQFVFLAATVPADGERFVDTIVRKRAEEFKRQAHKSDDHTIFPDKETIRGAFFNTEKNEEKVNTWYELMTPQPFAPYMEPIFSDHFDRMPQKRTYIAAKDDRIVTPDRAGTFAHRSRGQVVEVEGDHDVMLTNTEAVAEIFDTLLYS